MLYLYLNHLSPTHRHSRYKKHTLAKALSNKTDAELRSVLGVSHSPKNNPDKRSKDPRERDASPAADRKKKVRVDEE